MQNTTLMGDTFKGKGHTSPVCPKYIVHSLSGHQLWGLDCTHRFLLHLLLAGPPPPLQFHSPLLKVFLPSVLKAHRAPLAWLPCVFPRRGRCLGGRKGGVEFLRKRGGEDEAQFGLLNEVHGYGKLVA